MVLIRSSCLLLGAASLLFVGCGVETIEAPDEPQGARVGAEEAADSGRSPRLDVVEALRADLEATRHPADGQGRAWIEGYEQAGGPRPTTRVASADRWVVVFEAGPLGVAQGGAVFFQVSPFWGWSTPQVTAPDAPGYSSISHESPSSAEGLELETRTLDQQLLGVFLRGGSLAPGERLRFEYGAGTRGAHADRFAERRERIFVGVDGDGDGVRAWLDEVPEIDVLPGPPARLLALLPSTRRVGEAARLTLAVLDARGDAWTDFEGTLMLRAEPIGILELPAEVRFDRDDEGVRHLDLAPSAVGVVRVSAEGPGGLQATTNPLQVADGAVRILWGDLQNHSNISDGTGLPEDLLRYARDVAALDVVSITDHDHWGLRFLDQSPETWKHILEVTEAAHVPGWFVTLPGFEWTHWVHGHRHVVFFDAADARLLSSMDPATDHPDELWSALEGLDAMTIAHHTAGGPIAADWSIAPSPHFEPVTEIVSVHGASEAADAPHLIHRPVEGNYVRDALARGYRFGFLGSSDGHDGHPGLAHLASPSGGLAAILADEATRPAVAAALRARRVYATNGPRIVLRAVYGGYRMGADVPVRDGAALQEPDDPELVPGVGPTTLLVQAFGSHPIAGADLVRGRGPDASGQGGDPGGVATRVDCTGQLECSFLLEVEPVAAGEWLYVRVVQLDGGAAWSSPFYFVTASSRESQGG